MRRWRSLTEEEQRLWSAVAETAKPLDARASGRKAPGTSAEPARPAAPTPAAALPTASRPDPPGRAAAPRPSAMPSYQPPTDAPRPAGPGFHPIERPVRRKIAKGRLPIEGRIDLHDRTQGIAHYVLLGFLRQAQAEGLRIVLVITGRGASFGSRGVIRRALPHWFETPEFRHLVSGFEPAERTHGGEGAFYVRIRRR